MTRGFWRIAAFVMMLTLAGGTVAVADDNNNENNNDQQAVLRLPVSGRSATGDELSGTASINRFERRGNDIVAIGFVSGLVRRGGNVIGTAVAGEVTWPVAVRSGGALAEPVRESGWSVGTQATIGPTATCNVLHVSLGPQNVNLLGIDVSLAPIGLDIAGQSGTPLGDLVCAVSNLLGNVAAVVNLLNGILKLVTGLLGGLLGV